MRTRWIPALAVLFAACTSKDMPATDTTAAAGTLVVPAMLTEADVAGTWAGTMYLASKDSVVGTFTDICAAGTCRGVMDGSPNDTTVSTYTIMGDSLTGIGQPYVQPGMKDKLIDHYVLHMVDGKAVGTVMTMLASKPDSIINRMRFEAIRK